MKALMSLILTACLMAGLSAADKETKFSGGTVDAVEMAAELAKGMIVEVPATFEGFKVTNIKKDQMVVIEYVSGKWSPGKGGKKSPDEWGKVKDRQNGLGLTEYNPSLVAVCCNVYSSGLKSKNSREEFQLALVNTKSNPYSCRSSNTEIKELLIQIGCGRVGRVHSKDPEDFKDAKGSVKYKITVK